MSRVVVVALFAAVAAVGCGTTKSTEATSMYGGSGKVVGVVALPATGLGTAAPCDALQVKATYAESGDAVGKVVVRQSRNRCSYEVTRVPTDAAVKLEVVPQGLQCEGGAQATASEAQVMQLQYGQTKLADFRVSCGA